MTTLDDYRNQIPWTRTDLARHSGLDYGTVLKAEGGQVIMLRTAVVLAETLSKALGRDVAVLDIEGLNVKGVRKKVKAKEIET